MDVFDAKKFKKPTVDELKKQLTPLEYAVTQQNATENPYHNAYASLHDEGIYVDRVSGEPLFSSRDKFDASCGWPSFTQPLESQNIITRDDTSLLALRTEVRSKHADSHLGHVFNDGPKPNGLRYCINSAALRFIHRCDLAREGYGEYEKLFEEDGKKS